MAYRYHAWGNFGSVIYKKLKFRMAMPHFICGCLFTKECAQEFINCAVSRCVFSIFPSVAGPCLDACVFAFLLFLLGRPMPQSVRSKVFIGRSLRSPRAFYVLGLAWALDACVPVFRQNARAWALRQACISWKITNRTHVCFNL